MSAFNSRHSDRQFAKPVPTGDLASSDRTRGDSRVRAWLDKRGHALVAAVVAGGLAMVATLASSQGLNIGEGGTPSYSLALQVPPGIGGMQPNVGLAYTGGSVNGPVGYGWTLEGISTITRCGYTAAIDGFAHGVDFGPNDKLCLDGQRLIQTDANGVPVNGTVTSPSPTNPFQQNDSLGFTDSTVREYRTEKDMFARIRAYGAAGGVAANGPAYFKVWTKAGQIYEYGVYANTTSNANLLAGGKTVVAGWAASRISDTLGNFIDFQYTQRDVAVGSGAVAPGASGHEWNLAEIRYTGHGTQLPTNKVVFTYVDRPATPVQDVSEAYHKGSKTVSVARLDSIRTYVNWSADVATLPPSAVKVKTWKLGYDSGAIAQRSRVHTIKECIGAAETTCMPATTFNYAAGGTDDYRANTAFAASSLSNTVLQNNTGTLGVILGDFNGDGRTDILRWSDTPSLNQLWTSNGDGAFTRQVGFNITTDNLFKSDGCYASYPIDFNGDGVTDLLRVRQSKSTSGGTCPAGSNFLYLSKGDGTFTVSTLPASISLEQVTAVATTTTRCGPPAAMPVNPVNVPIGVDALQSKAQAGEGAVFTTTTTQLGAGATPKALQPCNGPSTALYSLTAGSNFHLIDANGDGKIDIITTVVIPYSSLELKPGHDFGCSTTSPCTHVYMQNASGAFVENTGSNLTSHSVYGSPGPTARAPNAKLRPYIFDVDGDGISDLVVDSGTWRSNGDGNFTYLSATAGGCDKPLDFNGDGRADCLYAFAGSPAFVRTADGVGDQNNAVAFNLLSPGQELVGTGLGVMLLDINGDGRTDILRWEDNTSLNALYLSNGDGSFTLSSTFRFNAANTPVPLKKSDGTVDLLAGDFTGHGHTEFLRVLSSISSGEAGTNQLYVKLDQTPVDQLQSEVDGSGLTTSLTWVPLSNSSSGALGARYAGDRGTGNAAVAPVYDLVLPAWVVATSTVDSGVGSTRVSTEYWYAGLKASNDGRGLQGFREVRRQSQGANGADLSVVTQYLQMHPYTGIASKTETWNGDLNQSSPMVLSRTTNIYCDSTAAAGANAAATAIAPCTTTSKVQVPYLYLSNEQGWELGSGLVLPGIVSVNTFNAHGDPTNIAVTTSGTAFGLSQVFTKVTASDYFPDTTSGDSWILGRLKSSTQTNTVPNSLASIATSAGNGKFATATQGALVDASLSTPSFANTIVGQSITANATLTNTGGVAVNLTVPGASSVTGTDFAFGSTTCGTSLAVGSSCVVSVRFAPTAVASRSGQLVVQTEVGARAVSLAANGIALPALSLIACTPDAASTTPTASVLRCGMTNTGLVAATSITYSSTVAGMTFSGASSCAASSNCGGLAVSTPTAAGTYTGTITATPNAGTAASYAFSLVVYTKPALTLSACSSTTTTTPTAATISCTVSNTGQTAASSIAYSSTLAGTTFTGPTGICAGNAACGTVIMSSPTAAGVYSGTLTATPANGNAGSTGFALTVRTDAVITLGACSSNNSVAGTAATYSCTVTNTGQSVVNSIAYTHTASGGSAGGPIMACGPGAVCGTATFTSPTTAGTYSGSLVATPSNGTGASSPFSVTVLTPAALSLGNCSATTNTIAPTPASITCTLSNTGGAQASGIVLNSGSGTVVSTTAPTNCAGNSTCGTVTVTSPTAAGSWSGSMGALANGGATLAAVSYTLTVLTPPALVFSGCSSNNNTVAPTSATMTCTLSNTGQAVANNIQTSLGSSGVFSFSTYGSTCLGNATCGTITLTTPTNAGSYVGTLSATATGASSASAPISLTVLAPAALTWGGCSSNTNVTAPTSATMTCTLSNTGGAAASGISVSTTGSQVFSFSTIASTCAAGSSCGTATVTTPTSAGSYSGNLTATATGGLSAATPFALTVFAPATMTLSACSQVSTTAPTPATMTCTISNTGAQPTSSISYSVAPTSMIVAGPTGACGAGAVCGTVVVTSPTTAGTYNGSLTATPSAGLSGMTGFILTVSPAVSPFTSTGTPSSTSGTFSTWTFTNPGPATSILAIGVTTGGRGDAAAFVNGGTCAVGATIASGGTCTVSVSGEKNCGLPVQSYTVAPWVRNAGGTGYATQFLTVPGVRPPCP